MKITSKPIQKPGVFNEALIPAFLAATGLLGGEWGVENDSVEAIKGFDFGIS